MTGTLGQALRNHPLAFSLTALGFLVGYHALLALVVIIRFDGWPNYFTHHDLVGNLGLIVEGTSHWRDLLPLLYQEPWLEFGYRNAEYYGIAEWSYLIMPSRLLLVVLSGVSMGMSVALLRESARDEARQGRRCLAATGGGAVLLGLGTASLTWIVCCAYPSWVVLLAMLGVGTNLALAMEPLGVAIVVGGISLQLLAVFIQAKQLRRAGDQQRFGKKDRPEPRIESRALTHG